MQELLALVECGFSFDINTLTRSELNTLTNVIIEKRNKESNEIPK